MARVVNVGVQSARQRLPALARSTLSADIFPICVTDVPVIQRMRGAAAPDATASTIPKALAQTTSKADRLSAIDLKRFVRQRRWDASSGGSIVLSGKGRTTEVIRNEVNAKLLEESPSQDDSSKEPPIKVFNDGTEFFTSGNLTPWQCRGWESPADPPQEVVCKLVAAVLHQQFRLAPAKNVKLSKWGSYDVELARCFTFRGALVGDKPCISVLVSHEASPPPELNLAELCSNQFPERVIGLEVRTLAKHMTGEVVEYAGQLGEGKTRAELMALTKCDTMRELIRKASDHEACWRIKLKSKAKNAFTYIASQLQPLLTFSNMEKLDRIKGHSVDSRLARDSILTPYERRKLVDTELDRLHKLVPDTAARIFPSPPSRVSSEDLIENFTTFETPELVVGGDTKIKATRGGEIWRGLQKHGLYRYEPSIGKNLRLCGYVLGSPTKKHLGRADKTFEEMSATLQQLGVVVDAGSEPVKVVKTVEAAMREAEKDGPHAVIFFSAPGSENLYYSAKQECLRQQPLGLSHLASQWVNLSRNDHQKPALMNMALQLCAKAGHTPYVLDSKSNGGLEPVICGVDVCHLRNPRAGNMEHVIAGLQLRRSNGEVEHSWVYQGKIQGESIPSSVWRSLVSKEACAGRQVVIHRDGRFTDDEKSFLEEHAGDIEAQGAFGMVEIVKHAAGTPRMYSGDKNAPPGTFLRLSETEGLLTSGSCPNQGTRNPLLVRVVSSSPNAAPVLSVEAAAEDLFRLSSISYSTLYSQSRLPVTTKTADKAAYFHASLGVDELACLSEGDGEYALMSHGRQQYWL